jgi:hypothetical protein
MSQDLSQNKMRAWFTEEIKFILTIGTIMVTVGVPYFQIKEDIALIKNNIANINSNHEQHIQDIQQSLLEMKTQQKNDEDKLEANQSAIIKLLTVLHLN